MKTWRLFQMRELTYAEANLLRANFLGELYDILQKAEAPDYNWPKDADGKECECTSSVISHLHATFHNDLSYKTIGFSPEQDKKAFCIKFDKWCDEALEEVSTVGVLHDSQIVQEHSHPNWNHWITYVLYWTETPGVVVIQRNVKDGTYETLGEIAEFGG